MKKPTKAKAADEKKPRENYVTPPEGFEVPDVEDGETFEAVVTFTKKKDGICITAWDGIPVKEEDADEREEEEAESIGAGARRAAQEGGY